MAIKVKGLSIDQGIISIPGFWARKWAGFPIDDNGADNHSQNSYSEFPSSLLVIRLRKWNQAELFPRPTLTLSPALCFPPETEKEVSLVLSKPNFPISPASIFLDHPQLLPCPSVTSQFWRAFLYSSIVVWPLLLYVSILFHMKVS